MAGTPASLDAMVTSLVPSLSRSLAEQFNVFRVMRHGTHEKQLSNVFAWLLREDATHGLDDAFQRVFVDHVNRSLPPESALPRSGYRVLQEVDTSGPDALGKDIADIVLNGPQVSIVVENFEASDGHGHSYPGYLAYGAQGAKRSVVVLLCARRETHRQVDGWDQAVVVTYAELLEDLRALVTDDKSWRRRCPQQLFFLEQMFRHFLEGPAAMNIDDRIAFIRTMCETGEADRYGYRPQAVAAQEFANLVGQHALRQFEEGRSTLSELKGALRRYAQRTLMDQVNAALTRGRVVTVHARFVGTWEWCVTLERADSESVIFLEFGPTAAAENARAPEPLHDPDYTKVFITRKATRQDSINHIAQTDVGLDEVLAGLSSDDVRLRDGVLEVATAD